AEREPAARARLRDEPRDRRRERGERREEVDALPREVLPFRVPDGARPPVHDVAVVAAEQVRRGVAMVDRGWEPLAAGGDRELLLQLARERAVRRLARLDPAARHVPLVGVGAGGRRPPLEQELAAAEQEGVDARLLGRGRTVALDGEALAA